MTGDSVTMVSDAIWTAKPVALVPSQSREVGAMITRLVGAIWPGHRAYLQDLRLCWRALPKGGVTDRLSTRRVSTIEAMRVVLDRVDRILESLE